MRKLSLRKDVLAELTVEELTVVAGGAQETLAVKCFITDPCITPPVTGIWCLTKDPACW